MTQLCVMVDLRFRIQISKLLVRVNAQKLMHGLKYAHRWACIWNRTKGCSSQSSLEDCLGSHRLPTNEILWNCFFYKEFETYVTQTKCWNEDEFITRAFRLNRCTRRFTNIHKKGEIYWGSGWYSGRKKDLYHHSEVTTQFNGINLNMQCTSEPT